MAIEEPRKRLGRSSAAFERGRLGTVCNVLLIVDSSRRLSARSGRCRTVRRMGRIGLFADEVDGAPNGIERAKMVVVESAIWKGAVHGQVYHRYIVCHARRA
jgi:hypothetical protein